MSSNTSLQKQKFTEGIFVNVMVINLLSINLKRKLEKNACQMLDMTNWH